MTITLTAQQFNLVIDFCKGQITANGSQFEGVFHTICLLEQPAVVRLSNKMLHVVFVLRNQHILDEGFEHAVLLKFSTPVVVFG